MFRRICNFLIESQPDPNFTQIVVKCLRMTDFIILKSALILWKQEHNVNNYVSTFTMEYL